jgi:hypothetical protein
MASVDRPFWRELDIDDRPVNSSVATCLFPKFTFVGRAFLVNLCWDHGHAPE